MMANHLPSMIPPTPSRAVKDDPAHDDAVEDDTFPQAAEASQNLSRPAGVAECYQLDVGDHTGSAP
jgi:hypothetical protein